MYRLIRSEAMLGRRRLSTTASVNLIPPPLFLPLPIPDDELATIQRRLNYTFANRTLLEDALIHVSYPGREKRSHKSFTQLGETTLRNTPECYSSPDLLRFNLSPHKIARTALRLNLYSFLRRYSPKLDLEVQKFTDVHEGKVLFEAVDVPLKVPKVLPDLVYALFGAIMIDCNINGEMAWQKMRQHLEPIYSWEDVKKNPMDLKLIPLSRDHNMEICSDCKRMRGLERARVYVDGALHGFASCEDPSEALSLAAMDALNKLPSYMLDGTTFNTDPKEVGSF